MAGASVLGRPKKLKPEQVKDLRVIGIRATGEWATWLEGLATEYRTTIAGVVDRALTEWAESQGYEPKPPKRTP